MRRRAYFNYNGNSYYTGTKMLIKGSYGESPTIEVTFKCVNVDTGNYVYTNMHGGDRIVSKDRFYSQLIKIIEPKDLTTLVKEYESAGVFQQVPIKDSQIDGMALGWMWYVFLMAISTIFHDRIGLWILISVVFFSWRAAKRSQYSE